MQKIRNFILNNRKIAITGAAIIDTLCLIGVIVITYKILT